MYVGVDCGTQGTKALLVSDTGDVLGRGYAKHDLIEKPGGAREQQPAWWVEAMQLAVRSAVRDGGDVPVKALSVSGQQHGLVVLDEDMQVIRPAKLWNDTETAPQNEQLVRHFGGSAAMVERFGIAPLTGYTVSKLLWLKQHEPHHFQRVRHICLPHDYLNFWLTGVLTAEAGDASGTGFFDVRNRQWIREILDYIDGGSGQLRAALPPILDAAEFAGHLKPQAASALGLTTGCAVASGGGDNMMGALGTGNVRAGVVTLSLGTSSTVYTYRNGPLQTANTSVAPFCSSSGGWLPLVCTMNATNVVDGTLKLLGLTLDSIDPVLLRTEPGAQGLTFLPFLNGERTPDLPTASGTIAGLSANNYSADNLLRAAIEGVTFGILNGLELILGGAAPERVVVIGGGARSRQWRQLIADATGAVIDVPMESEAGCLGAAVQAMYAEAHRSGNAVTFEHLASLMVKVDATNTVYPDASKRAPYRSALETYNRCLMSAYPQLKG